MTRVVHFDIPIDNAERAGTFYRDALGMQVDQWGPIEYWMLTGQEDEPGADGALTPRDQAAEGVIIYLGVDDIDMAMERVEAAGGTLVTEKMPIPTVGWSAHVRDTEGNLIGLFQSDASVPMPEGGFG